MILTDAVWSETCLNQEIYAGDLRPSNNVAQVETIILMRGKLSIIIASAVYSVRNSAVCLLYGSIVDRGFLPDARLASTNIAILRVPLSCALNNRHPG